MKHRLMLFGAALGIGLAGLAGPAAAEQPHPFAGDRQLTVMTRNLYLGTDLRPIFSAPTPFALFAAAGAGYAQVEANRPAERMAAIADEIAAAQPDVVAIQEAAIFRTDFPPDGPASPAETTTYDLLDLLVDALDVHGAPYEVVGELSGTDAELPAGLPPTRDVRLTDRIALLARADEKTADLKIESVASGHYAARLVVPTVAGPIAVPRGWISADVKVRGKVVRVVATHLEAFSDAAQVAQAGELLAGPAATDLPVVIAGDLNTRADGLGSPTYGILRNAGFADSWSGPGTTCCRAPDLSLPSGLDKRVDLVLSRGGFGVVRAEIVDGKTPSGLWHSDHAGFVATLGFPD
jgi:endonuclease/exonuclease/phosphatase family metal-dependent hydrolase